MGVWEFWESKIDYDKKVRAENPRTRDAEKIASQVEENLTVGKLTVGTPMLQKIARFEEDSDSLMFGRRGSFYQDDLGRMKTGDVEEEKKKKKNHTTPSSGKIRGEMHATAERKEASLIKSALLRHERSPMGGRVMKMRKGTPTKMQKVKSLRILFENTSSPTKQVAELLLQSSGVNPFNLSTTTKCSRLELKICADQSDEGTQTGLRQEGRLDLQPDCDWPSQGSPEPVGPIGGEVPGEKQNGVKSEM